MGNCLVKLVKVLKIFYCDLGTIERHIASDNQGLPDSIQLLIDKF